MDFTYDSYKEMLLKIKNKGYTFTDYENYKNVDKPCIIRHDVDYDLDKAVQFAKFEAKILPSIKSTYFILLGSDFYNVLSKKNIQQIKEIIDLGFNIGLHFDESKYGIDLSSEDAKKYIIDEIELLSHVLDYKINSFSMHRPNKNILNMNLSLKNIVNSYSDVFFGEFKYVSDSRMNWRENILEIIDNNKYDKLHILTHSFWYFEERKNMHDIILNFIENKKEKAYLSLNNDFKNLEEVISIEEIKKGKILEELK